LTPVYTIDKRRSNPNNESQYDTKRWLVTWNQKANGYRLPTEAEWEYACRAGTLTPYNIGNRITTSFANFSEEKVINKEKTTEVGSFAPNAWGLYDMHGNVQEFCWDWYGTYQGGRQVDPIGALSGFGHVLRGGSWRFGSVSLRSANRWFDEPFGLGGDIPHEIDFGMRLVRNAQ